jgi:hypothetical protein
MIIHELYLIRAVFALNPIKFNNNLELDVELDLNSFFFRITEQGIPSPGLYSNDWYSCLCEELIGTLRAYERWPV